MSLEWIIQENKNDINGLLKNESIFNVSNGYIGVRGNFEEGYSSGTPTIRGTYINAFFEETTIPYGERAFAFPETMQKIVNIIDAQTITLSLGEECFSLFEGEVKSLTRLLDMKRGCYIRKIHWVSPMGKELKLTITRMASFTTLELFTIHYEIEKINFEDEITISSKLDGNVENYTNPDDPRVSSEHAKLLSILEIHALEKTLQIVSQTNTSGLKVAVTTMHEINQLASCTLSKDEKSITSSYTFPKGTKPITLTKYTVFTDSRRHKDPKSEGFNILNKVMQKGIDKIIEEQLAYLKAFWDIANIQIVGDDRLQQSLRFNVYQLLQGVGKDNLSNISAKGLSGEGYEGHYFWDTEIYILPFFILCNPSLAKQLLKYRYTTLDEARIRANELGHKKGAAYAWRTITGKECSSYFPAGTAQYHINGDIAYTYIQYYLATGDIDFIKEFGAEVVFETARIWIEIGHFYEGLFKIDAVTGPDEYTAIVNNNYYTNTVAKYNLTWAVKFYNILKENDPQVLNEISSKIHLVKEEILLFDKASKNMYLPYNKSLDMSEQDDTFLSKAIWDFDNTPHSNYPLLLHYHPLTIYRYQVLKQADTLLAHFLLDDGISESTIKNSYDYYEKLTTHDSSLSCAIYSIMASKIGYLDKAYKYFIETARLDLDDTHNNTKDGLHMANMGGTWMAIVYGFIGLRIKEDHLVLNPTLPTEWSGLTFNFLYKGATIQVNLTKKICLLAIKTEQPISIKLNDMLYTINNSTTIEVIH